MRRRHSGFSLAEITMMMLIFAIFSLGLVASLTLSMRYWKRTSPEMVAEQNARVALQTMTQEMRQASHPSTWQAAFLAPSSNTPNGSNANECVNEFAFTENSTTDASGNPVDLLFEASPDDPQLYEAVVYWIGNSGLTTPPTGVVPTGFSPFTSKPNPLPTPLQPGSAPNINSLPNWGNTLYRTSLHYDSGGNQISSTTAPV
ncbi:MAG: PulJ/GspJ family protein, partial [Candidatus Xenobia bacterium]